jgi:hypothetical protein
MTSEMNSELIVHSNDETTPGNVSLPSPNDEGSGEGGTNDETDTSAEKGMRCESKRLYEKKSEYGDIDWVEEIPADVKARNEAALTDSKRSSFALILHTQFDNGKGKLHSIVVQSPLIKEALKDILRDYPGIFLGKDPLTFEAPFRPIVHRWKALEDACGQDVETEIGRHLKLFKSTLESELQETFSVMRDFATQGAIEFEQLWTIFAPGSLVASVKEEIQCAFKVTKTKEYMSRSEGRKYFIIYCYYIDWDGTRFGRAPEMLVIPEFEGNASPSDLLVYPLENHPKKNSLMAMLIERGKRFQALADTLYKAYDGIAMDFNEPASYHVCSPDGLHYCSNQC